MKIGETGPVQSPAATRRSAKAGAAGGPDFAALLDAADETGSVAAPGAVEEAATVGLLGFQEVSDEDVRRHKEVRRGNDMLDSLERLRGSLLTGSVPPDVLREMETRLALQRQQVSDPRLTSLLDDIELRVAVELTKLEQAQKLADGDFA